MHEFIAFRQIEWLRMQMNIERDKAKRKMIARLLAEEEARLVALTHSVKEKDAQGQDPWPLFHKSMLNQ